MPSMTGERRASLGDYLHRYGADTAARNPRLGAATRFCVLCGDPRYVGGGVYLDPPRRRVRRFVCAAHELLVAVWKEVR